MTSNYLRVIPRDLFNESKLLKCVGRLVLLIHDGFTLNEMFFEHKGDAFEIDQDDDGDLFISNIHFFIGEQRLQFVSRYNSKSSYTLYCFHDYSHFLVFDESGEYTDEFKDLCNEIAAVC